MGGSHATILGTRDGGRSWALEPVPLLPGGLTVPGLTRISCSGEHCLATGIRLGSVLVTIDGGRHWFAHGLSPVCKVGLCTGYTAATVEMTSPSVGYAGGGNQWRFSHH